MAKMFPDTREKTEGDTERHLVSLGYPGEHASYAHKPSEKPLWVFTAGPTQQPV